MRGIVSLVRVNDVSKQSGVALLVMPVSMSRGHLVTCALGTFICKADAARQIGY